MSDKRTGRTKGKRDREDSQSLQPFASVAGSRKGVINSVALTANEMPLVTKFTPIKVSADGSQE
jgi:hypothetical protein